MKIEFIYTYKEGSQDIIQYPFVPQILENPETLSDFATAMSSEFEVSKLVKISCCVYLEYRTGIEFPEWYNRCNGKLWYTDGKLELER